ncbi:hypothetical protein AGMMS49983_19440 [Clostridia bacterium]|nr:hypothetical protein AGMMS49983_19440 [Clostridia bacterium]
MRGFFTTLIENPKKRKMTAIVVVVIFVVVIGTARYVASSGSDTGDILRRDSASATDPALLKDQAQGVSKDEAVGANSDLTASAAGEIAQNEGSADVSQTAVAVFVDVGGAVVREGVIALPPGSRITDAIEAAGGLTEGADVSVINRAQVVSDGDKLYIPTTAEVENGRLKPSIGLVIGDGGTSGAAAGGSAAVPGSAVSSGNAPGTDAQGRVNLNTADTETLQLLNGVGPATAQKIIDYRNAHGQFKRIEDLMNVSGIGQKTFERLKGLICV